MIFVQLSKVGDNGKNSSKKTISVHIRELHAFRHQQNNNHNSGNFPVKRKESDRYLGQVLHAGGLDRSAEYD